MNRWMTRIMIATVLLGVMSMLTKCADDPPHNEQMNEQLAPAPPYPEGPKRVSDADARRIEAILKSLDG